MTEASNHSQIDYLGIVIALVQYMEEGNCCDELKSPHLFRGPVNRILAKIETVNEENFAGDYAAFKIALFTRLYEQCNKMDQSHLRSIEDWLNREWENSAALYVREEA